MTEEGRQSTCIFNKIIRLQNQTEYIFRKTSYTYKE